MAIGAWITVVLCVLVATHEVFVWLRYRKLIAKAAPHMQRRFLESWLSYWGRALAYREGYLDGLRYAYNVSRAATPAPETQFAMVIAQSKAERGELRGQA